MRHWWQDQLPSAHEFVAALLLSRTTSCATAGPSALMRLGDSEGAIRCDLERGGRAKRPSRSGRRHGPDRPAGAHGRDQGRSAKLTQCLALSGEILLVSRAAGVADQHARIRRGRGDRRASWPAWRELDLPTRRRPTLAPGRRGQRPTGLSSRAAGQNHPSLRTPGPGRRDRSDLGDQQTQERDKNHFTRTTLAQRHRHPAPSIADVSASPAASPEAAREGAPGRLTKGTAIEQRELKTVGHRSGCCFTS